VDCITPIPGSDLRHTMVTEAEKLLSQLNPLHLLKAERKQALFRERLLSSSRAVLVRYHNRINYMNHSIGLKNIRDGYRGDALFTL